MTHESVLLALLPILFFGLIAPDLFRKLKFPYITSLILVGAVMGPNMLGYTYSNDVVEFFGFLGFTFLMLLAGLETDIETLSHSKRKIGLMAMGNGLIPFVVGFTVTLFFGYDVWAALIVGTVFISSSIALVVPAIKAYEQRKQEDGQLMVASIIVEDILSLLVLAVIFQGFSPITELPLPQYFAALFISVLFLKRVLPSIAKRFMKGGNKQERFERQLRFIIVLMMGVLLYFSFLGVHPMIAAFLVGLFLSGVMTSEDIRHKLHTLGYGLFVPVFFFIVGMEMDLELLLSFDMMGLYVPVLFISFMLAKVIGGYLGARLAGMGNRPSTFFGVASIPQLTTTLAATYAATTVGIIDTQIATVVTLLSIITTILAPLLLSMFSKKLGAKPVA